VTATKKKRSGSADIHEVRGGEGKERRGCHAFFGCIPAGGKREFLRISTRREGKKERNNILFISWNHKRGRGGGRGKRTKKVSFANSEIEEKQKRKNTKSAH